MSKKKTSPQPPLSSLHLTPLPNLSLILEAMGHRYNGGDDASSWTNVASNKNTPLSQKMCKGFDWGGG